MNNYQTIRKKTVFIFKSKSAASFPGTNPTDQSTVTITGTTSLIAGDLIAI